WSQLGRVVFGFLRFVVVVRELRIIGKVLAQGRQTECLRAANFPSGGCHLFKVSRRQGWPRLESSPWRLDCSNRIWHTLVSHTPIRRKVAHIIVFNRMADD